MDSMAGKRRRKFTVDYRREAAHLVLDTGRPISHVARDINVSEQLLGRWVAKERAALGGSDTGLDEGERAELERLRLQVQVLQMENEFLGKASAFFAARTTSTRVSR